MGKIRFDVKEKILRCLEKNPSNITDLAFVSKCTRQTARIHVTELERDNLVISEDLGNQTIYYLKR